MTSLVRSYGQTHLAAKPHCSPQSTFKRCEAPTLTTSLSAPIPIVFRGANRTQSTNPFERSQYFAQVFPTQTGRLQREERHVATRRIRLCRTISKLSPKNSGTSRRHSVKARRVRHYLVMQRSYFRPPNNWNGAPPKLKAQ